MQSLTEGRRVVVFPELDLCLHGARPMAVDLTPKSHVDTPAWQSFEMRMRARAAERRRAKRQRRLRRLTFAGAGLFAVALGMGSAVAFKAMDGRGVIDRALSAREPIEEAVARQPIVIDWPPPPDPPKTLTGAPIGVLPLPADWSGNGDTTGDAGTTLAPEPAPATEAAATEAPSASLSRGETPDDVMFPDQIQRRTPPAPTASTSPARERQGEPSTTVPTPGSAPAASRVMELQPGVNRQPALNDSASARRTAAIADRPNETVEPAPALANQPDATASAANRSAATGAPSVPNLGAESSVANSGRSLAPEPSVGTPRRNPAAEPTVGTPPAEPSVGTPRRNPAAEPSVGTADPRASVRAVLDRYRSAYQRLDAAAARAVWPAVDAGALARAFNSLSSQQVSFEACFIDVADRTADATCKGQSRVVPKVGGGIETARRTWNFKLRQAGSDWVIEKATVK